MKLFFTREEKEEVKMLKLLEKSNPRMLTKEDYRKIEYAEMIIDGRRRLFISIFALLVSILNLIFAILSRLWTIK